MEILTKNNLGEIGILVYTLPNLLYNFPMNTSYVSAARIELEAALKQAIKIEKVCRAAICKLPKGSVRKKSVNGKMYFEFVYYEKQIAKSFAITCDQAAEYEVALKKRGALISQLQTMDNDIIGFIKPFLAKKWPLPVEALEFLKQQRSNYKLLPASQKLILPSDDDWLQTLPLAPDKEPPWPESRKFMTLDGFKVRSKNEMLASDQIHVRDLVYRYEVPIIICGRVVWPDFVIFHPIHMWAVILECFCQMDQKHYQQETGRKIADYEKSGFHCGERLLTLFCNSDEVIDINYLSHMLDRCFFLK